MDISQRVGAIVDSIIEKLALDDVDIEDKLRRISTSLETDLENTPKQNTRTISRIRRWLKQLDYVSDALKQITEKLMPILEKDLQCKFSDSELLQIVMFQPSTRNLFMEIRVHFRDISIQPVDQEDYENLEALSDMGEVLAMLGDAVISIAVLHHLWRERTAEAGEITQKRAEIVSNENMAELCDKWGLYKMRIHFDPKTSTKSEMEHIKGTLLEAVYGILYINEGFEKIISTVQLLM